jgi:hypothetical protein
MFSPNSRYAKVGTYVVTTARGASLTVTRLPIRPRPSIRGFHRRTDGQRPDGIAAHYLADATAFWRLCDAGDAIAPDALAARDLVAVPAKER